MGCNSYGNAMIGCRLDNDKLAAAIKAYEDSKKVITKGCGHEYPEKNKFCPECGSPRETVETVEICEEEFLRLLGFKYETTRHTTDQNDTFVTSNKKCLIETGDINSGGTYRSMIIPSAEELAEIEAILKSKLEPHGLWEAKNFKLWVIGYCSY